MELRLFTLTLIYSYFHVLFKDAHFSPLPLLLLLLVLYLNIYAYLRCTDVKDVAR